MTKWVYRLESTQCDSGLWYNESGEFTELIVKELPNCVSAQYPMGYDERYRKDGKQWFSSVTNPAQFPHWFSIDDAKHFIAKGFKFYRYLATEYVEYDVETTFIRDTAVTRVEMTLDEIYEAGPQKELEI